MTTTDLLQKIPLFESLNDQERQQLTTMLKLDAIKKRELLFSRGDAGSSFYIIIKGAIKISVSNELGAEVTLALLSDGDFFGEMALLDEQPRSANATALENTVLYRLDRNDFFSFLLQNENTIRSILCSLSLRLRSIDDMFSETTFLTVSARLAKRLFELAKPLQIQEKESKEYQIRMSQQELASMLGVTRERINKELKILRDKGIVTTARNSVIIRDLDRLRAIPVN